MFKKGDKVFYNGYIPEWLGLFKKDIMNYIPSFRLFEILDICINRYGKVYIMFKEDSLGYWWYPIESFHHKNDFIKIKYDLR